MSGYSDELSGKSAGVDAELQEFLMMEKQKAQVNAQVSIAGENNLRLYSESDLCNNFSAFPWPLLTSPSLFFR
jgi:mitochondrial import inner membrane translocase subunit TIM8